MVEICGDGGLHCDGVYGVGDIIFCRNAFKHFKNVEAVAQIDMSWQ